MKRRYPADFVRGVKALRSPYSVQQFLDSIPYNTDEITRSAGEVLRERKAHCLDGALFAAAALEYHGADPLLMDLRANGRDDDHIVAVYRHENCFGAIAKSNFAGLRFREPIYRNLRELAVSYFNSYFNLEGERTLVEYSNLVSIADLTSVDWRFAKIDVYEPLATRLDKARHYRLYSRSVEQLLSPVDSRLLAAETLGLDPAGVFKNPPD